MDLEGLLPLEVRLGASRYNLVLEDKHYRREHAVDGLVDFDDLSIHIVTEDRPLSEVLNTLIHELLHVCYREWNIKPRCGEERTVTALGTALTGLFVQNPELLHGIELITEEVIRG